MRAESRVRAPDAVERQGVLHPGAIAERVLPDVIRAG
jgi:hypothetical protein